MKIVIIVLVSSSAFALFFYLLSRIQMKGWLTEIEGFLDEKLKKYTNGDNKN